ncbi:MAG: hypothetical protein JXP73_04490 [Deltaproteobacteria bacterium]|nr:hypothetical protein [Deltaproteobacteria bacterium]
MKRPSTGTRWSACLAILVSFATVPSCKCRRSLRRGDAAAVIVVAPRRDAAPPPKVPEQEPNESHEQAQALALGAEASAVHVEASLEPGEDGKVRDVDLFKLVVPGERQVAAKDASSVDAGAVSEDPRLVARRLWVEIAPQGGAGLGLQLQDEAGRPLAGVRVETGAVGGVPNLAVLPGLTYFIRVRPLTKPAKGAPHQTAGCQYLLTARIGDFEVADEREPNGTAETAIPVAVTGTVELAGYHGWPRDEDFYRMPLPETLSALDAELDAVVGVASSIQVLDGSGKPLASAKGRRSERLALRNVILQPAAAESPPTARHVFLVVRAESGQNREQRYVLRITCGLLRRNAEVEPNDKVESATLVGDGTYSGYLTSGDVDWYRYEGEGARDVTVEVSFPARVRGKIESFRPGNLAAGAGRTRKPRQTVTLSAMATHGQPLALRVSGIRADGNPNEPYAMRISSVPSAATAPAAPANP